MMRFLMGLLMGLVGGWWGIARRRAQAKAPLRSSAVAKASAAVSPSARATHRIPASHDFYVRHTEGGGLQVYGAEGQYARPQLMPGDTVIWHVDEGEQAVFQFHDADLFDELKVPKTWTQACPIGDTTLRLTVSPEAPVGTWAYTLFCTRPDHACTPVEPPPRLTVLG